MATYYVDQSATNDGDGSAPNQAASPGGVGAFNTFTGHLGASGDTFWVRRYTLLAGNYSSTINFNVDNVKYIGWPKVGDDYYSTRPAAGISEGWDADSADYAQLWNTVASASYQVSGGASQEFHRVHFKAVSNMIDSYVLYSSVYAMFKDCRMSQDSGSANHGMTVQLGSGQYWRCIATNAQTSSSYFGSAWGSQVSGTFTIFMYQCESELVSGSNSCGMMFQHDGGTITYYMTAIDCIFRANGAGKGIYLEAPSASAGYGYGRRYFYNCDIYGGSSGRAISFYGNGNAPYQYGLIFDRCSVKSGAGISTYDSGVIRFVGGTDEFPWYFKEFTQTVASDYGIKNGSVGLDMYIENATFMPGNTSGDVHSEGTVYMKNAIFYHPTVEFSYATGSGRSMYVNDYGGNKGYFKQTGDRCLVTSDITRRVGGNDLSYRVQPTGYFVSGFNDIPLGWVGTPGREVIFASVTAGTRTITIYGAHKFWGATPPNKRDLWFEGSYYANASGAVVSSFSTRDMSSAALDSDTSTWTGDSGMILFKMSITITVGQDCLVPIRILFSKFITSGPYFYIDPTPVVV